MFFPMNHECAPSNILATDNLGFINEDDPPTHTAPTCTASSQTSVCSYSYSFDANQLSCPKSYSYISCSHPPLLQPQQTNLTKPKLGTYEIDRTIGKGIFSVVKLARHTITGINLAVKIIDKTCLDADNLVKVYRESVILKKLHHPNVVKLFQVMETPRLLCLVMEYLPNGEVFDYIASHGRFSETEARVKFLDVLSAIDYAHSCGIVHRDLKAENLLFDENMNIKVIDFSFGTHHQSSDTQSLLTTWCGSPPYAAPEIFKGEPYVGAKADIWSLGVVLYVMVCGMLPFDAQPLPHLKNQVLSGSFRVPYWLSLTCERLIRWMLSKQPCKRPSTREIFLHPWFTESLPSQRSSTGENPCTDSLSTLPSDEFVEQVTTRPSQLEPGTNLAADLELGRVNEFVLLIMESYGMSRAKIMESLNSRAYDHLMATYLLLGEKVRQNQYRLNLDVVMRSRDESISTGSVNIKHPKPSRVDSAVGSVSEADSVDLTIFAKHNMSDSETTAIAPPFGGMSYHPVRPISSSPYGYPPLATATKDSPRPIDDTSKAMYTGPAPQSNVLDSTNNGTLAVPHCRPPEYNILHMDTAQTSWLCEPEPISPTVNEPMVSTPPKRTLARRKYGVSNPPACLDELARAVLAQQAATVSEQQLDDTEDSS